MRSSSIAKRKSTITEQRIIWVYYGSKPSVKWGRVRGIMDADQKYAAFITEAAKHLGFTFVTDSFDGRESESLIDGMAVDDVWGWLLPCGVTEPTDDYYGCFVWSSDSDGHLHVEWEGHAG